MFPRDNKNIIRMLGAEVETDNGFRPGRDQQSVSARVANVIEACCDEWLDDATDDCNWQTCALQAKFWDKAAARLIVTSKYWAGRKPSPSEVYKIAMAYTTRFDPNGRGATEDEDIWGFRLGGLTWGARKAEIDVDLMAKPWVSSDSQVFVLQHCCISPVDAEC